MKDGLPIQVTRLFLAVYFLAFLTGCEKFTRKESENLAPFA